MKHTFSCRSSGSTCRAQDQKSHREVSGKPDVFSQECQCVPDLAAPPAQPRSQKQGCILSSHVTRSLCLYRFGNSSRQCQRRQHHPEIRIVLKACYTWKKSSHTHHGLLHVEKRGFLPVHHVTRSQQLFRKGQTHEYILNATVLVGCVIDRDKEQQHQQQYPGLRSKKVS